MDVFRNQTRPDEKSLHEEGQGDSAVTARAVREIRLRGLVIWNQMPGQEGPALAANNVSASDVRTPLAQRSL